jgi:hypothetical protein
MSATKSYTLTIVNAAASAAGSTYASPSAGCQSSWIDLTTVDHALISGIMVNSGSAPTVGCTMQIDQSPDNGTTVRQYATITAGIAASTTYPFNVPIDGAIGYARVTFYGNATNSVTNTAEVQKIVY